MPKTPSQRLIELELGQPLHRYVRKLRSNGMSWRGISLAIRDDADIDVSAETLRVWFPETKEQSA